MLTSGWGKAVVGLQGIVKESKSGIPSASAQCIWANAGGLEMIASAAKVFPDSSSGSKQAFQHPFIISVSMVRLRPISPFNKLSMPGIKPGSEQFELQLKHVQLCLRTFDHITQKIFRITTYAEEF
jgi:hypothetical protein